MTMPTIAVAESCTGGLVSAGLVGRSGAPAYFVGGVTCYNLEQRCRHLGVDAALARECDCVSAEVAAQMARGASAMFSDADLAVATTGFAKNDEDDDELDR